MSVSQILKTEFGLVKPCRIAARRRMKYFYAYKTSDGIRHEGSIEAESREAAFKALRAKGIKAIKVVAADGSKANGEIRGFRLRTVIAVGVIAAVLGFLLGLVVRG